MNSKKSCLITGATGLIGREVLKRIDYSQMDVYVICRSKPSNAIEGVNYICQDLSANPEMDRLPPQVDIIIHMAQSENYKFFPAYAREMFDVNTNSTVNLLEYARSAGVKNFIFISSGGVYGNSAEPLTEDSDLILKPRGFYLGTKLCSEIFVREYKDFFKTIIMRPFFVYGPGQKSGMLIPRLINNIKENNPIELAGNNGITINPLYVTEAASAIIEAMSMEESIDINIAGPENITLREICNVIGRLVGVEPVFKFNDDMKAENCIGDIKRMREFLIAPQISFPEGISLMIRGEKL